MLVKAKAKGFYKGDLKQPGEVFEVKDGTKGSWFEVVKTEAKAEAKAEVKAEVKPEPKAKK